MTTQIITLEYNNTPVFFQLDAFINATAIAGKFNKQPRDYLKTSRTKEYIEAVKRIFLTEENQLVKVVQGGASEEQGTWLHPKLAIDFARWLSADFAVWCDMQIEKILHPVQYGLKQLPPSPYISESEAAQFMKSIQAHCNSNGGKYSALYKKVYEYYGITSYKHIPAGKLEEAAKLCGMKLLKLTKAKMPDEIPLLTFTQAELDTLIAERVKAIEGEVIPKHETVPTDKISISLNQGIKMMTLVFGGTADTIQRYSVSVDKEFLSIHQMDNKLMADVLKDQGYIVFDKTGVSARQMVMHHIPPQFLPDMIEEAWSMLRRIEAGKAEV